MAHHIGSRIPEHKDRRQRRYAGRVLLVSARADERRLFADSLNGRGFCVLEAHSAAEAYYWAREVPVSIIITDIELPGDEDGLCLTCKLKGDRRIHQVPVVVLADRIISSVRSAARGAGCDLISARASLRNLLPLVDLLISGRRRGKSQH
jgi:DNA-binding response OmpR family regulator